MMVNILGCCVLMDLARDYQDIYGERIVHKFFQCCSINTLGYDKLSAVTGITLTKDDFKYNPCAAWGNWVIANAEEKVFESFIKYKGEFLLLDLMGLRSPIIEYIVNNKTARFNEIGGLIENVLNKIPYTYRRIDPLDENLNFFPDIDRFIENILKIYNEKQIILFDYLPSNNLMYRKSRIEPISYKDSYVKLITHLKKYVNYFTENLNCKIVKTPENLLGYRYHKWGGTSLHFTHNVYTYLAKELHSIIHAQPPTYFYDKLFFDNQNIIEGRQMQNIAAKLHFEIYNLKSHHNTHLSFTDNKLYTDKNINRLNNLNIIYWEPNKIILQNKKDLLFINHIENSGHVTFSDKFSFFYSQKKDGKLYIAHEGKYVSSRSGNNGDVSLVALPKEWELFEYSKIDYLPCLLLTDNNYISLNLPKIKTIPNSIPISGVKLFISPDIDYICQIPSSSKFINCEIYIHNSDINRVIEIVIGENCILENIHIDIYNGKFYLGNNSVINDLNIKICGNKSIYIGENCYLSRESDIDIENILNSDDHNVFIYDNTLLLKYRGEGGGGGNSLRK